MFASSSSVYGDTPTLPKIETMFPTPKSPYALNKLTGEYYCKIFYECYGLPTIALRYFNIFGKRQNPKSQYSAVIPKFITSFLKNESPIIFGDGEQTRDFTYVTDVADAFISAAESNLTAEAFNVGSGNHYSVNQLIALLGGDVVYIPRRPGEPDCTFADVSKINRMLGWEAKVSLEEGVQQMLDRLEDWRDAPVWNPESIQQATSKWFQYLGDKVTNVQ